MTSLGLLGRDIQHSKSKNVYENLLKKSIEYTLFDYKNATNIPSLESLFSIIDGLSITSPYKDHFAKSVTLIDTLPGINSINCIAKRSGQFFATNTDVLAIKEILKNFGQNIFVTVLGDGVMAKVTTKILDQNNLDYQIVSRKKFGPLENFDFSKILEQNKKLNLIINTCSREFLYQGPGNRNAIFWDYNYSLPHHADSLPRIFKSYSDGMELLTLQAKFALKFWSIS